ncbi:MAG: ftsE [Deltaproteobacteria bacterium]|nr:ftsE [Deltaproteobacteria bacterium]
MIQLFHVSKIFGPTVALKDIDLRIRTGEFVFVTGPSGAGKTTLLRLIFGAEPPTEGQILINGINLSRISGTKLHLLRRKIGFVFQDFKLLSRRTVFQNVALALEVTGEKGSVVRKKTHQMLRAVALAPKEEAYPIELSGGEQQRVAIARAMINDPLILLADFRSINLRGTTVVIATHNRELLRNTDQRIILLHKGKALE